MKTLIRTLQCGLTFGLILLVVSRCGNSSTGQTGISWSGILKAMTVPTAETATSRSTASLRSKSYGGYHCGLATLQLQGTLSSPKLAACILNALESSDTRVRQAASGYNYYSLTIQLGGNTLTRHFRYGTLNGHGHINYCDMDNSLQTEIDVGSQGLSNVLTVTYGQGSSISQYRATAGADFTLQSLTHYGVSQVDDGSSLKPYIVNQSLTVGSPNTVSSYIQWGSNTIKLYCAFDTSTGSSEYNSGGSTYVESWTTDTAHSCVNPSSSGTYYSAVNDPTKLTAITAPSSTPAFIDDWSSCAAPSGSTLTDVTPTDSAANQAISACFGSASAMAPPGVLTNCP